MGRKISPSHPSPLEAATFLSAPLSFSSPITTTVVHFPPPFLNELYCGDRLLSRALVRPQGRHVHLHRGHTRHPSPPPPQLASCANRYLTSKQGFSSSSLPSTCFFAHKSPPSNQLNALSQTDRSALKVSPSAMSSASPGAPLTFRDLFRGPPPQARFSRGTNTRDLTLWDQILDVGHAGKGDGAASLSLPLFPSSLSPSGAAGATFTPAARPEWRCPTSQVFSSFVPFTYGRDSFSHSREMQ